MGRARPHDVNVMDARLTSAAAERNKDAILAVLRRALLPRGVVLELASGTGQHAVHFASALRDVRWQPSDPDPVARASISAWREVARLDNLAAPVDLDVHVLPWPLARVDAVVAINMVHISPWSATTSLFAGASSAVGEAGVVFLYGPYFVAGKEAAPSNEAFDRALRAENAAWGVRRLEDVVAAADDAGFTLDEVVEMPANNLSVVFHKRAM